MLAQAEGWQMLAARRSGATEAFDPDLHSCWPYLYFAINFLIDGSHYSIVEYTRNTHKSSPNTHTQQI